MNGRKVIGKVEQDYPSDGSRKGGIDEYNQIVSVGEIPMALIRRKIHYHVLTNLRKAIPRTWENQVLINEMFEKYPKGFIVYDSGKAKNRNILTFIF